MTSLELNPFIMLDGQAEEAIAFYEKALGAQVLFKQKFGEAPDRDRNPVPEGSADRLAHSVLNVGGATLFVADFAASQSGREGNRVQICITAPDADHTRRIYEALLEEGQANFPLQPVHFSPAYGVVTDKFGVVFQVFTKRA
ncbi:VOC family protein [Cohnella sp. CBP 2801]|uniref:VOC family protein n=2 Tax=Cohnella zeiphila TaxID=2761120 RepID=A0A7X0SNM8_9BACL|nr:VOC family protein [Cohnella zeiphila]